MLAMQLVGISQRLLHPGGAESASAASNKETLGSLATKYDGKAKWQVKRDDPRTYTKIYRTTDYTLELSIRTPNMLTKEWSLSKLDQGRRTVICPNVTYTKHSTSHPHVLASALPPGITKEDADNFLKNIVNRLD